MPAKGKLVDRYYNQTRILRRSGVLPQKRQQSSSSYAEVSDGSDNENVVHGKLRPIVLLIKCRMLINAMLYFILSFT